MIKAIVIDEVEGNCKFYYTEAGAKVAAMNAHYINNILPELIAQKVQFFLGNFFQILRGIHLAEERTGSYFHSNCIRL